MCRVLGVSTSGYYGWVKRLAGPLTGRAAADAVLLEQIRVIHQEFAYYGAPRIHRELVAQHLHVGRHRVARLMRVNGICARRGKLKVRHRTVPPARRPEITDRVRRCFNTTAPNRLWFTDLTMIRTGEGWLRAAVILDAFNREVVTWSTAHHETPRTVITALSDAIQIRRPVSGCVIHSDRGYQFTSHDWVNLAGSHGTDHPSLPIEINSVTSQRSRHT